jgi:hypothetical protein
MGVFVLRPSRKEFRRLIYLKCDPSFKCEAKMSEQGFLNAVYAIQWQEIGFENNANLASYTDFKDFRVERVKIHDDKTAELWLKI